MFPIQKEVTLDESSVQMTRWKQQSCIQGESGKLQCGASGALAGPDTQVADMKLHPLLSGSSPACMWNLLSIYKHEKKNQGGPGDLPE
jgi:hypothetical protein